MPEDGHIRALWILETLAGLQQPAALKTIAERAGLPQTKAYRVLRDLQEHGYVDHIGRRGYRVGGRAFALASLVGPRPALLHRVRPVLMRLSADVGATTSLLLRSGAHRVIVLRADPPGTAVHPIAHIGERSPLTSGCAGAVILAFLPAQQVDEVLLAPESHPVRTDLPEQLAEIRRQRYAISQSANHPALNGIAAPVLDPDSGHALGSLAIAGHPSRMAEPVLHRFATPLLAACAELGPRLATVLGPSSSVRLESLDVTIQDVLDTHSVE
ncbi:IclR family acetate operon transcriptional repressor [Streptomyces sp. SAI-117]|uniref:IclR family transcriptional regulator n=1 Tax=unclassified Streptomyces TaxID=2593676 RepID=UPI0024742040|nr:MULTISPECIES: IclR family transcriptional regulator [unclassified Streptomyces]MDH6554990.1 IclR family acetate operon transcriptional repressor [Streptomyces sp. SAI-041]MDH6574257.1 IclR family acetate operon transcriptional repressor [Streptomyces sp. SAI-117]MDH6581011.1 IclR family acetate operon transcriptional repressor [Streptomyces sp. SAI-133]